MWDLRAPLSPSRSETSAQETVTKRGFDGLLSRQPILNETIRSQHYLESKISIVGIGFVRWLTLRSFSDLHRQH
jgi:hypothetical protein